MSHAIDKPAETIRTVLRFLYFGNEYDVDMLVKAMHDWHPNPTEQVVIMRHAGRLAHKLRLSTTEGIDKP